MSCGDFDGKVIAREANNKKFFVPNYLRRWINLKKVFPSHKYKPGLTKPSFDKMNKIKK